MDNKKHPVTLLVKSPEVRNEFELLLAARDDMAISGNGVPEGLVIMEIGEDPETDFGRIAQLMHSDTVSEIFLTAREPDKDLLVQAMRLGIKEFLGLPAGEREFTQALERHKRRLQRTQLGDNAPKGKVVTVLGARNGVGATTLAVNLAVALNERKSGATALVDLRLPSGDAAFFLDLEYQYTWVDLFRNASRLDATYLAGLMVRHPSGLMVLPSTSEARPEDGAVQALERSLAIMRESFDHVVIDANPYLDHMTLRLLEYSDMTLLAFSMGIPALASAKKLLEAIRETNSRYEQKLKLVATSHLRNGDLGASHAAEILGQSLYADLPFDYQTALSAVNHGIPVMTHAPKSALAKAIAGMAANVAKDLVAAGRAAPRQEAARQAGFLGRIFRKPAVAANH